MPENGIESIEKYNFKNNSNAEKKLSFKLSNNRNSLEPSLITSPYKNISPYKNTKEKANDVSTLTNKRPERIQQASDTPTINKNI